MEKNIYKKFELTYILFVKGNLFACLIASAITKSEPATQLRHKIEDDSLNPHFSYQYICVALKQ